MSSGLQSTVYQFPNGDRFEGQLLNPGVPLSGSYFFANGDHYKGSFLSQMKHGMGIYTYSSTG